MIMDYLRKLYRKLVLNTKSYKYTNIYKTAKIGRNCVIGSYTEIGDRVVIGNDCKIQAMVFIPKGVTIGNDVFIGPRVTLTNDLYPKAGGAWKVYPTIVEDGVSIGAGTTIVCGVKIGKNARIGAGSVITKDVPENGVVYGNPARLKDSNWK